MTTPTNPTSSTNPASTPSGSLNTYNPDSPRVRLARYRARFHNKPTFVLVSLLLAALLVGGTFVFSLKSTFGWCILGFASPCVIFLYWAAVGLKFIPAGPTDSVTDLLSADLIAKMDRTPSPTEIVQILNKDSSAIFLMTRFALPIQLLAEITNHLPASEPVFANARDIRSRTKSPEITGAILAIAIIETHPQHEAILNKFGFSLTDLYQGITWYEYLSAVISDSKKPFHSGGIARDFAFGFTPTLKRFAINLSSHVGRYKTRLQLPAHQEIVKSIISHLSDSARPSVALVGAPGSGRSTIIKSLAETLMDSDEHLSSSIKFSQIYSLDAPSIISAAARPGETEALMMRLLNEIYSAKNIILCLDHAHLFFENGTGSVDISNLLLPILENGSIRIILIMDEQKFLEISSKNPALTNALNKIPVPPTDEPSTIKVMMDRTPFLEYGKHTIFTYHSLTEAYRLSSQYIHDIANPGKSMRLLESALNYATNGLVTAESVQSAAEAAYGVKVKVASAAEDRNRLLNLESLIHERMIDQEEAVSAVASALRRAAAGIKNQGRPIGTFLFLGPTGVGKTELAKSLAAVYFGGEDNIIRLDMNEFVTAGDVARLIADGTEDPESLTAQVSKHPFSVILLDEIEKAHPSVLTTLLQVLDEGILRDSRNHEISFRDSIIIATSNAGESTIREQISAGASIDSFKETLLNQLISSGEFKPEFLNRFDEICFFKPLSKEDLLKVLDLILTGVNKTLEPQKITVELDDTAKAILLEKGYDPQMGARPMRRIVQKTVENIVAAAILAGNATPGSHIRLTAHELTIN